MLAFLTPHGKNDNESGAPKPLLLFVHIPKTAGTTLRTVLSMNEPGARSRAVGNVFKGGGGTSRTVIPRLRGGKLPNLTRVRLIRGHVPLGVRELYEPHLPEGRELRCFTFLREPVERTLSHFFAIREDRRAYGLPPLAPDATLEDALAGGYVHDNLQTRMLSGLVEPFGEVDDDMLERAKRNLSEGLIFFGLTERFDESLVLAKQRLGLRTILYRSSRVNTGRPRGDDIPAELRESAQRCNRYDLALYAHAQELFDTIPEHGKLGFQIDLAAMRAVGGDGSIDVTAPPPADLEPDKAWPLLLEARARVLRAEFERRRGRAASAPATEDEQRLQTELRAVRAKARKLEKQVEELRGSAKSKRQLTLEIERLKAAAGRTQELERALSEANDRLELAQTRKVKLERRLKRLRENGQAEASESPRPVGRRTR
jgi:hypothetical protein